MREATHKDDDYWIITPVVCFIWHSQRQAWIEYAKAHEVDMSKLTEISR